MRHPHHLQENGRWRLRRGELGVLWGAFGAYHWQLGVRVSHLTITNVSPVKVKVCRPWRRRRPGRVEPASALVGIAIEASGSCHGREYARTSRFAAWQFREFDVEGGEGGWELAKLDRLTAFLLRRERFAAWSGHTCVDFSPAIAAPFCVQSGRYAC